MGNNSKSSEKSIEPSDANHEEYSIEQRSKLHAIDMICQGAIDCSGVEFHAMLVTTNINGHYTIL